LTVHDAPDRLIALLREHERLKKQTDPQAAR
jgi:hypothetical protein